MRTLLKTGILLSLMALHSCHYLMPSCIDGFEIYKRPITTHPKFNLQVDRGAFKSKNGSIEFFFKNGRTKNVGHILKNNELDFTAFSSPENWQEYTIIGDTIIFQGFNHHTSELCRRWVFETKGLITSDSSYLVLSTYDYRFKTMDIFDPPILITFFPSIIRPDSTSAWYQDKSWYKDHVHRSRK